MLPKPESSIPEYLRAWYAAVTQDKDLRAAVTALPDTFSPSLPVDLLLWLILGSYSAWPACPGLLPRLQAYPAEQLLDVSALGLVVEIPGPEQVARLRLLRELQAALPPLPDTKQGDELVECLHRRADLALLLQRCGGDAQVLWAELLAVGQSTRDREIVWKMLELLLRGGQPESVERLFARWRRMLPRKAFERSFELSQAASNLSFQKIYYTLLKLDPAPVVPVLDHMAGMLWNLIQALPEVDRFQVDNLLDLACEFALPCLGTLLRDLLPYQAEDSYGPLLLRLLLRQRYESLSVSQLDDLFTKHAQLGTLTPPQVLEMKPTLPYTLDTEAGSEWSDADGSATSWPESVPGFEADLVDEDVRDFAADTDELSAYDVESASLSSVVTEAGLLQLDWGIKAGLARLGLRAPLAEALPLLKPLQSETQRQIRTAAATQLRELANALQELDGGVLGFAARLSAVTHTLGPLLKLEGLLSESELPLVDWIEQQLRQGTQDEDSRMLSLAQLEALEAVAPLQLREPARFRLDLARARLLAATDQDPNPALSRCLDALSPVPVVASDCDPPHEVASEDALLNEDNERVPRFTQLAMALTEPCFSAFRDELFARLAELVPSFGSEWQLSLWQYLCHMRVRAREIPQALAVLEAVDDPAARFGILSRFASVLSDIQDTTIYPEYLEALQALAPAVAEHETLIRCQLAFAWSLKGEPARGLAALEG